MRGIDLFCASQASTSVHINSMDHNASSSSTVHLGSSRLIDRHNPIITDRCRSQGQSRASAESDLLVAPQDILNPKADLASRTIKSPPSIREPASENDKTKKSKKKKNKESGNSDFVSKISCAKGGGFVSPFSSTRFLLEDRTSLLDIVPDCEPVVSVVPDKLPAENKDNFEIGKKIGVETGSVNSYRGSSSRSSEQVVVLRVSLHCKGCAGKVKKHISRMPGVTSFNIDFAAKKVTVVGDVTPVEVLASISKVKNAKLWTPPKPPSTTYSEINKSKTVVV